MAKESKNKLARVKFFLMLQPGEGCFRSGEANLKYLLQFGEGVKFALHYTLLFSKDVYGCFQKELSDAGLKDESSTDPMKKEEEVFEDALSQQSSPTHEPAVSQQGTYSVVITDFLRISQCTICAFNGKVTLC